MRSDTQPEDRDRPREAEGDSERGRGLLRGTELVAEGAPARPHVRPELLLAFFRALIKNTMNGDVIAISLMRARSESGASDEEVRALVQAIRNERPACNTSDMFPDF